MKKFILTALMMTGLATATDRPDLIAIHTLAGAGQLLEETNEPAGAAIQIIALGLEQGHDLRCKATHIADIGKTDGVLLNCAIFVSNPEVQ